MISTRQQNVNPTLISSQLIEETATEWKGALLTQLKTVTSRWQAPSDQSAL